MPRLENDITICGRSDDACVEKVAAELQNQKNDSFVCNCLPGCYEVTYDAEISMAPLLQQAPLLAKRDLSGPNVSVMHIYYKNNFFRSQKKDELIGFTEFLSNTGGLLGLFMGFSVFSIIEIFYFLTIRPYNNYIKVSERRRQTFRRVFRKFKLRAKRKATSLIEPQVEQIHNDHIIYPYVG